VNLQEEVVARNIGKGVRSIGAWVVVLSTLAVVGASPARGQQSLELADGDQLSGSVKAIGGGTWLFTYRGQDVEVSSADIVSFTAPDPIGLRLSDNSIVVASVAQAAGGLTLTLADGSTQTVAITDLEAVGDPADLGALEEVTMGYFTPFGRFWALSASAGASFKGGNSETSSVNGRLDVDRTTDRDKLEASFLITEERNRPPDGDAVELVAQRFIGGLRAEIFPWTKVFLYGSNIYTRDRFSDIDLRVNLNAGAGLQLAKSDRTDLKAALGLGGRSENFTSDTPSKTVGTGNFNAQWIQLFGGFRFDTGFDFTPALEDFNDYQIISDTNLTATLIAGLGFRVGFLFQYDNTPADGIDSTDTTLTTSLAYTLGR